MYERRIALLSWKHHALIIIYSHPAPFHFSMGNELEDKIAHDARHDDAALQFLDGSEVAVGEQTNIDEKKLMRKVDWILMPLMVHLMPEGPDSISETSCSEISDTC